MKPRIIFFILWLSLFSYCQELPKPKWKISDVQLSVGIENSPAAPSFNSTDFLKLAPNSSVIPASEVSTLTFGANQGWNASLFNFQLGIQKLDQSVSAYRKTHTLRLGINAQILGASLYSKFTESTQRVDTLISVNNSSVFGYVDSVFNKNIFADYSATDINFDAAFIWSTDANRRFSLFAGFGSSVGIIVAAHTQVSNHEWGTERVIDANGNPIFIPGFDANQLEIKSETFRNQAGFSYFLYVPFGLDFRMGKTHSFWKQIHLFAEFRPGMRWIYVPEIDSRFFPIFQSTIGVKVSW